MLFLKCDQAVPTTDDEGRPCVLLCTEVIRPQEEGETVPTPPNYVTANWPELPERYVVSGPLGLIRHPGGGAPVLTAHYSVFMMLHGPVYFFLSVYDPAFDPAPFIGKVFAAEGQGGEPRRELYFRPRWTPGPECRVPEQAWRLSLEQLGLSDAVIERLEADGMATAADLCVRTAAELLEIRDFGANQLQEVRSRMAAASLCLWGEEHAGDQETH